jgi:NAD(P)-dependent dehydrogenase (short-subunit alcohol dehydrogenase family)
MTTLDDLAGKVVLVTGASSGIGEHLARQLALRGARVAAAARRTELLNKLAAEFVGPGGTVSPIGLDLRSTASIQRAVAEVEHHLGPIEILVNNAGIVLQAPATRATEDEFDRQFDTNVKGTFFVTQACARRMIELEIPGRIVTVASVAGLVTMPQLSVYGMTKAALVHMTRSLAAEWARYDLSVNAICPGYVATDLNAEFMASEAGRKVVARLPKRRLATPEGLVEPLMLLLSGSRSRFINGAILTVDDGYSVS